MREPEEKERGLLSIRFWYPERRFHFIIINRLDENMDFVIFRRHGEDSERERWAWQLDFKGTFEISRVICLFFLDVL